jgi:hypothetical protein
LALAGTVRAAIGEGWAEALELFAGDDDDSGVAASRTVAWELGVCDVGVWSAGVTCDSAFCDVGLFAVGLFDVGFCDVGFFDAGFFDAGFFDAAFRAVVRRPTTEPLASLAMERTLFVDSEPAVIASVTGFTVATDEVRIGPLLAFTAWPTAERPSLSAVTKSVTSGAADADRDPCDARLARDAVSESVRF